MKSTVIDDLLTFDFHTTNKTISKVSLPFKDALGAIKFPTVVFDNQLKDDVPIDSYETSSRRMELT